MRASPGANRPRDVDQETWSRVRKEWIAAIDAGFGQTTRLRTEIARSIGFTYAGLYRYAKRSGWAGARRNNRAA